MYYLGITGDMGKTKYVLIDKDLRKILEIRRGITYVQHIDINFFKTELLSGINEVIERTEIEKKEIAFIFLGFQGYGESERSKKIVEDACHDILSGFTYAIDNDSISSWAAGTLCRPGINIVSGTGSIAFGMNERGESERVGGWGPIIGDEGSAQWIGIKLVNEYTKQKDGRKEETRLIEILETDVGIDDYYGVVDLIFNKYNLSMTEFAKLCDIGILAAEEGCIASRKIFEDAAYEIFLLIKALKEKLNMEKNFIVSYTGGAFRAENLILEPLKRFLKEADIDCIIQKAMIGPAMGSALMAYTLGGNEINTRDIKKKLLKQ
ncbi:MAG: N-acetylglucosamine kinase [Clostridium sp.]|uniref:N-acetylglucosamine kinase n=1 Tax=Clostridium sp. TaxID=1506 RepID=UPI003F377567